MNISTMKDKPTTKKILLVDDEETLRLSIKQVLSEDGYEVIIAKNGISGAAIVGHALETAADDEVFQVYVDIGGGSG